MDVIYFDNNSTTRMDDEVLQSMMPYLKNQYGNPSSKNHSYGWIAHEAVEQSRKKVAQLINAESSEIIFTSGSTESLNLAMQGLFNEFRGKKNEIIICSTEHSAVHEICNFLSQMGVKVHTAPVNFEGIVDVSYIEKHLNDKTFFVAVMLANNETGVLQDISEISKIVHQHDCYFVCDATQAIGKMDVDVQELGVDLMPLSAHKFHGPKGIGALYIRKRKPHVTIKPLSYGGGQENNLRPGTLPVAQIVGLGKACEIAAKDYWEISKHTSKLRTFFEHQLELKFGSKVRINGCIKNRLANTSNILFYNVKSDSLLAKMPLLAASSGSACSSVIAKPSHVLLAMNLSEKEATSSVRFSFSKNNTLEEVELVIGMIQKAVGN